MNKRNEKLKENKKKVYRELRLFCELNFKNVEKYIRITIKHRLDKVSHSSLIKCYLSKNQSDIPVSTYIKKCIK